MNFLRGYQNSHGQQDIGLFTFYRQQAQRQNQALLKKRYKNKIKRKNRNSSIQGYDIKKSNKRLPIILENQKSKLVQSIEQDQFLRSKSKQNLEKITNNQCNQKKIEQYPQKKNDPPNQPQIFTSRKQMIINKKFRRNQFQTPEIQKKNYLSPRSQILTFSYETKDVKPNSSQQITNNSTINPPQSKQALPSIKYKVNSKHSVQNPQKLLRCIIQDEVTLKSYRQIDPLIKKIKIKQKKLSRIKTDEDCYSAFVMFSNRQHRLLTQKKQVPLMNFLKQYSRNL